MNDDLMSMFLVVVFLISISERSLTSAEQNSVYVQRGQTAELCDNRTTIIFAYEYRSFDGQKNLIIEPNRHQRYSNPHSTSLLRIDNAMESDSGFYKCPQDDTEWQKLQVYVPVEHVYLSNLQSSSRVQNQGLCSNDEQQCLALVEGESLDVVCAADGYPRPAVDVTLTGNGTMPKIMALASAIPVPDLVNNQFQASVYEAYRLVGLTAEDNGRNVTCQVDMKQMDKKLILSTSKQLVIEFRPVVAEKSKKIYCGINQTRTVNCTVLRANPKYLRYSINGLSSFVQRRIHADQNDFFFTMDITPTSIEHFRPFNITANNSIGFDTCTYELIHGGVPDAITHCSLDSINSNITRTITISCTKSYAQGDNDGYACTLFKYNDKTNRKMFEEIARTKSCIFALENFHEPVEFRVAAFNRYGSLPVNTYGYVIRLNQPTVQRETTFFSKRFFVIIGVIVGGISFFVFLCCLCGPCLTSDRNKYPQKTDRYEKNQFPHSSSQSEELKPITDELLPNGTVYDVPSQTKYSHPISSTPISSVYHQQKTQQSSTDKPMRLHTVNNKFYGHPVVDSRFGSLPSTAKVNLTSDEMLENDRGEREGDESPVYSTTTDVMSESGSFLVPSSNKRYTAPAPKPRYSTLQSSRSPADNLDKTPFPLAKPRSRSNSRTRLNNLPNDISSNLYEERPASSSDSGIGLINGDPSRSLPLQSVPTSVKKTSTVKFPTFISPVTQGTEC